MGGRVGPRFCWLTLASPSHSMFKWYLTVPQPDTWQFHPLCTRLFTRPALTSTSHPPLHKILDCSTLLALDCSTYPALANPSHPHLHKILDCSTHPILDSSTHTTLDYSTNPALDCSTHSALDCSTHPTLDCPNHQELDCSTPWHLTVLPTRH